MKIRYDILTRRDGCCPAYAQCFWLFGGIERSRGACQSGVRRWSVRNSERTFTNHGEGSSTAEVKIEEIAWHCTGGTGLDRAVYVDLYRLSPVSFSPSPLTYLFTTLACPLWALSFSPTFPPPPSTPDPSVIILFPTKMDANEWDSILQFVADGLAQDAAPPADESASSVARPPLSRSVSAAQMPTPPVRYPLL